MTAPGGIHLPQGIDLLPAVLPREAPTPEAQAGDPEIDKPYVVIVYDDDWHSFEQVILQLQKATGCTLEKAEALAIEIDGSGRAIVFGGSPPECERVANILRQIKLQVETDRA